MVLIYALCHPKTQEIVYVGKSCLPLVQRLNGHCTKARTNRTRTPIGDWIRALQAEGLKPTISLLEEVTTGRWQDAERAWIKNLRERGCHLRNRHPGGNGAHTRAPLPDHLFKLLGKISDARIAEQSHLCRETITYHRRRAGIPKSNDLSRQKCLLEKGHSLTPKKVLPEEVEKQLGLLSDRALEKQYGWNRRLIEKRRKEKGIPPAPRPQGSCHPNSKLSKEVVAEIRRLYSDPLRNETSLTLAKRFNVHFSTIQSILNNETWRG